MYPNDLRYSETHEWVRADGGTATVGITYHAVKELGDIVNVDLPEVGTRLRAGDVIGSIDSVKAASDVMSPVGGEVVAINAKLSEHPEIMNEEPYGAGWLVVLKMDDHSELDSLMSADQYEQRI